MNMNAISEYIHILQGIRKRKFPNCFLFLLKKNRKEVVKPRKEIMGDLYLYLEMKRVKENDECFPFSYSIFFFISDHPMHHHHILALISFFGYFGLNVLGV